MGLALLAVAMSCEPVAPTPDTILGTYQLRETLFDPGDGSGEYQSVESDFMVTFKSRDRFEANGTVCDQTVRALVHTKGDYDLAEGLIEVESCYTDTNDTMTLYLTHNGLELIIGLPCIEGCGLKFEKIAD